MAGKRVLYAVTDPAQVRVKHPALFKKVFDLTFVLAQRLSTISGGDVCYFDTNEEAMAQGRLYDVVILQAVGNFIIEYRFLKDLDVFLRVNSHVSLLSFPSHTALNAGITPTGFDSRMMVVNVAEWARIGYPNLQSVLPASARPATIDPPSAFWGSKKITPAVHAGSDQGFVSAASASDWIWQEFPEPLRSCCLYIWPEINSRRLYEALERRDANLASELDQKAWIRLSAPRPAIWIYNSEPYRFSIPLRGCDAYFGPAAGFKYLDMLSHNPDAEFFFYDQNIESLHWIKTLKQTWDGDDFPAYVDAQPEPLKPKFKMANTSIEQNQQTLLRDLGGEEHFKVLWRRFRSASARFTKCNLFNPSEVQELISNVTAEKPVFYYSNIFSTNFTLTHFSREEAEERYRRFKEIVITRFPRVVMHGADVAGKWY